MPITVKSVAEIKAKLRKLLHSAQRRFIEQHRAECPENCRHALVIGSKVQACPKCGANPGEPCRARLKFEQRHTYDEIVQLFRERYQNKEWVVRELRDVAMLLWVLGQLEPSLEPDPEPMPDLLEERPSPAWMHLDGNTLVMSPELTATFAAFLDKVAERQPREDA